MVPPSSSLVGSTSFSSTSTMSAVATSTESSKVLAFLREYRALECSCCSNVFGFQHRLTGALFCVGGCHERTPPTPNSGRINGFPSVLATSPFMGMESMLDTSVVPTLSTANMVATSQTEKVKPLEVEKPKVEAIPVQKPVEAAKPQVVPTKTKPELPRPPELMKPKVEEPKRYMWSQMKYSENLVRPDAHVSIAFTWTPVKYTVNADGDVAALENFQTSLGNYAATAKTMRHAPIKDEIVIDEYEGAYYRARVTSVEGGKCAVQFIDYGDMKTSEFSKLIQVNDEIMKAPVFGMIVELKMPATSVPSMLTSDIEEILYGGPWILDMKKGTVLEPGRSDSYEVRLWDQGKENTLNELLTTAVANSTHPGGWWNPLKPDEQKEIAYLLSISSHFAETKRIVEETKRLEALEKNMTDSYVFKLDNADFPYTIQDLPLIKPSSVKGEVEVEITKFKSLSRIVALPLGQSYENFRSDLNTSIEHWISTRNDRQLDGLQENFIPEFDEMCIVQWPRWESVYFLMEKLHGKKWKQDYVDEHQLDLDIFKEDYEKYAGKWFRAACASTIDPSKYVQSEIIYQMFLVDLGKTTLIPLEFVYRMPHRFMIDAQTSVFLSLQLDKVTQYNNIVDDKWKHLLLPGMKAKIKFHWMFDEVNIVKLIAPSENDLEEHFQKPEVQEGIERQKTILEDRRRHRKVKKMSGMKGTFPKNMERVLAEEAENEKLLKPLWNEYSDFSRVHPDRVFQLCLPYVS